MEENCQYSRAEVKRLQADIIRLQNTSDEETAVEARKILEEQVK